MCGLAGYVGEVADGAALLAAMAGAIAHRGPDAEGIRHWPAAGLAHRRLSLVDLENGTQPMATEDGRLTIAFNGEIFNHRELRRDLEARGRRFRTASDTEVLLQLYDAFGDACLDRLNGDFAFAVWDARHQRMFLARDRMGVRPLFYAAHRGNVYFASEAKALFAVPGLEARLDRHAIDQIMTLWTPIAPRTAFEGVFELEPGNCAVVDRAGLRSRPYWSLDFPDFGERQTGGAGDPYEELSALLTDAVALRLQADVPVGSYLSGGLDSSLVTAIAAKVQPQPVHTFSLAFESKEHDERSFQHSVAEHLGTRHVQTEIGGDDIARDFARVVWHAERPVIRSAPAPLYALARSVRDHGIKAVLTGEGADEVFAGYDIFKEARVRRFCARQPGSQRRPLLFRRLYPYLPNLARQTPEYLAAFFHAGAADLGDPLFSHRPRFKATAATRIFLSGDMRASLGGYDAAEEMASRLPERFGRWHPLHQAQYLETRFLLPGYILSSQGDRMAMAHGVEGRFPFLDQRLVDFATRLDPELKLRGLEEKHILRHMADRLLPPEIARRTKQPYRAPDSEAFLRGQGFDFVRDALSPTAVAAAGVFDPGKVQSLERKCTANPSAGFRDNAAFMAILSTQILNASFSATASRQAAA